VLLHDGIPIGLQNCKDYKQLHECILQDMNKRWKWKCKWHNLGSYSTTNPQYCVYS